MFCANCGHQNEASFKFCASCGAPLDSQLAAPVEPREAAPPASAPAGEAAPSPPPAPVSGAPSAVPAITPSPVPAAPSPLQAAPPQAAPPPSPAWSPNPPVAAAVPAAAEQAAKNAVGSALQPTMISPTSPPLSGSRQGNPLAIVATVLVLAVVGYFIFHARGGQAIPPAPEPSATVSEVAPATTPPPTQATSSQATPTLQTPTSTQTTVTSPSPVVPSGLPTVAGASTQVQLKDAVICRGIFNNGAPQTPTTSFEPGQPFFCSAKALNLQPGSEISAVWQRPDGATDVKKLPKSGRQGSFYVYFTLEPHTPWSVGPYKLYLIADGVLQQTLDFQVVPSGPSQAASPGASASSSVASHVEDAVMCKSVDARKRPVNPTTTYGANEPFYCSVHVRDVIKGKPFLTKWYHGEKLLRDMPMEAPGNGSGWLSFELTAPSGLTWPRGKYQVQIYYDGGLARSVDFSVQ